jgi:GT2 family glycosyltransferase
MKPGERASRIDVAIVSHHSDGPTLAATLDALAVAAARWNTREAGRVVAVLLDNSEGGSDRARLEGLITGRRWPRGFELRLEVAGRNLGYGAGNNHALRRHPDDGGRDFVLVLNPDVRMAEDALCAAVDWLRASPSTALLVPRALDDLGNDLHLAHRYPDPLVFALRGAGPAWLRRRQRQRLGRYEILDLPSDRPHGQTVCASGCFLFLRDEAWQRLGGFDPGYFLYFEDYDLSCRALALGPVDYRPEVRILHEGGGAAAKGWRHRWLFARSAWRFFTTWGWTPSGFEARAGRAS